MVSGSLPSRPTREERNWAAIAHAPILGVITPLLIWAFYRDKSAYIGFHALQATMLQGIMTLLLIPGLAGFIWILREVLAPGAAMDVTGLLAALAVMLLVSLLELALTIYGLVGAVAVLRGKDFRYRWIGQWVERWQSRL